MTKRLYRVIGIILSLFMIILFSAHNHWISNNTISEFYVEELGADPYFKLERRLEKTNTYSYSINTIMTKSEELNQYIQDWVKKKEDGFLTKVKAQSTVSNNRDNYLQLVIQLHMNKVNSNLYTITFVSNDISGEDTISNEVKTFNMDLEENKLLELKDVLNIKEDNLPAIISILKKQLSGKRVENVDEWLENSLKRNETFNWLIGQNMFTFYFQHSSGPIKLDISLTQLSPYINQEFLNQYNIKIHQKKEVALDPEGKYIALTFDDGPSPSVTPRILETLKKHHAKATFFMLGNQVKTYPTLAKQVANEGHEIGNHSKSHPILTKLTENQMRTELEGTMEMIQEIIGHSPSGIRPPYGIYNDHVEAIAMENAAPIILWNVDSLDWKNRNAQVIKKLVLEGVSPGAIVLLHDIHPTTADALPEIMDALQKEDYQFITVSELLTLQEINGVGPYYGVAY